MNSAPGAASATANADTFDEEAYQALSARAAGSNVNAVTLLATDYFNHFNEVIMLIGLVPDMPEILEEAKEWQHLSYVEHFQKSSIADCDLAIEAYAHVPPRFKQPFEQTIEQLNGAVDEALSTLDEVVAAGRDEELREAAEVFSQALQRLVDAASAIVHGGEKIVSQTDIDALLGN